MRSTPLTTKRLALWRWLKELNIPDVDLLQSLYSGAYYTADLAYGQSTEVTLSRGQKQGDKSSPLLFCLVFNALLLALKARGVGDRTITGLRAPARGFEDDLALVTRSEADMTCLLQVVARFCEWSGMRVNITKSVATAFDFSRRVAISRLKAFDTKASLSLVSRPMRPSRIWE